MTKDKFCLAINLILGEPYNAGRGKEFRAARRHVLSGMPEVMAWIRLDDAGYLIGDHPDVPSVHDYANWCRNNLPNQGES